MRSLNQILGSILFQATTCSHVDRGSAEAAAAEQAEAAGSISCPRVVQSPVWLFCLLLDFDAEACCLILMLRLQQLIAARAPVSQSLQGFSQEIDRQSHASSQSSLATLAAAAVKAGDHPVCVVCCAGLSVHLCVLKLTHCYGIVCFWPCISHPSTVMASHIVPSAIIASNRYIYIYI